MKLTKFVSLLCLTFLFGGIINHSSYAETLDSARELAQLKENNSSELLEKKATELLESFFEKNFDQVRQMVKPELKTQITNELLEKEWLDSVSKSGSFQNIVSSKVVDTPESDLVIVTVKFQKETNDWIVIFNANQEIIGTDFPTTQPIEDIATEIVNSLAIGKFDVVRSFLHPFLKEDVFPKDVEKKWTQLKSVNGDFEKIVQVQTRRGSSIDNTDLVFVTVKFTRNTENILIMFDNNKKIIGMDLIPN